MHSDRQDLNISLGHSNSEWPQHRALFTHLLFPWLEFDDRSGDVGAAGRGVDGERDGGGGGRAEAVVREGRVRAGVSRGHADDLRGKKVDILYSRSDHSVPGNAMDMRSHFL